MTKPARTDLALLLSIAMLPACMLDVGDALTSGTASDTGDGDTDGKGTEGDDDQDTEGGESSKGDEDDDEDSDSEDTDDADTDDEDSDSEDTDDADTDDADEDSGSAEGTAGDGDAAQVCLDWDAHLEDCGFGSGGAAYCQLDLDAGAQVGPDCESALEDYYACLNATDCETLQAQAGTLCGMEETLTICGW
ncbi:MAG: hypothetical protein U0168_02775 [Nannocystaceae bacterium]